MRELWRTGWMHNRVRMIVASFLTKDLRLAWQKGAAWFWDTLVDADLANNTFGWQWTAGCGADAAPYFRIFNPVAQGPRFDPEGAYTRRWVPELASLPTRFIHAPLLLRHPRQQAQVLRHPGLDAQPPVELQALVQIAPRLLIGAPDPRQLRQLVQHARHARPVADGLAERQTIRIIALRLLQIPARLRHQPQLLQRRRDAHLIAHRVPDSQALLQRLFRRSAVALQSQHSPQVIQSPRAARPISGRLVNLQRPAQRFLRTGVIRRQLIHRSQTIQSRGVGQPVVLRRCPVNPQSVGQQLLSLRVVALQAHHHCQLAQRLCHVWML
ncbi:MAG: Deoxyribodipyrimidine photo-lyase [Chloroflexi bacterium ADurb.Bin222]|nr:MAG: Deoxyribodipyrimidine photo-lyase [Chloroflexi bacterium ADurb.Bin222]